MVDSHADVAEVSPGGTVLIQDRGDRAAALPGQEAGHDYLAVGQFLRRGNEFSRYDLILFMSSCH